jgi:hypothetical protein
MLALLGIALPAVVVSTLFSWIGLAILVVYLFVIAAWFEDDWWFKGLLFLALPILLAFEIGAIGFPGWANLGYLAVAYFLVGTVWSFFKWIILVTDLKKDVMKLMNPEVKHDNGKRGMDNSMVVWADLDGRTKANHLWSNFFRPGTKYYGFKQVTELEETLNITPNVSSVYAKARIFSWIAYWPLSTLKYVFERLLKDLVDFIIERLKGVYNLLAANIMKGFQV